MKYPVYETKLLGTERIETGDYLVNKYYYNITTHFNDGTTEQSKRPAYDLPMPMPVYKESYWNKQQDKIIQKLCEIKVENKIESKKETLYEKIRRFIKN